MKLCQCQNEWTVPGRVVPVVFAEASIAERIVLPATSGGCGAARLLGAAPLVGVEGDTCCLVAVGACKVQQRERGRLKGQPGGGVEIIVMMVTVIMMLVEVEPCPL